MSASKSDAEAVGVIRQYVAEHKGWRSTDYIVAQHGRKDRCVVYFVTYLPEQGNTNARQRKPLTAGGGESFAVYYDPAKGKIVKEMGFE